MLAIGVLGLIGLAVSTALQITVDPLIVAHASAHVPLLAGALLTSV